MLNLTKFFCWTSSNKVIKKQSNQNLREPFLIQKNLLPENYPLTIFDLGAHFGQTSEKYAFLFPRAMVYAFEPFPQSFRVLEEKASSYERINPYQLAVSDTCGQETFYVNQRSDTNSLFPRPENLRRYYPANAKTVEQIQVNTITLDGFVQQAGIAGIDILKMDIQGGELLALKGGLQLLASERVGLIYTELMFVPHYQGGALFYELCSFLANYGYSLYDLFLSKHGNNGQLRQGDGIFISNELRAKVVDNFTSEP